MWNIFISLSLFCNFCPLLASIDALPNKLVMHHGDEYRQKQEQK